MKTHPTLRNAALAAVLLSTLNLQLSTGFAQGTAFAYQGALQDNGAPANGSYSLRFILYNVEFGGSQAGPTLTNEPVAMADGLFTTTLDFGAAVLDGSPRWLEIAVRTNGSAAVHTALSPRQPLDSAPYAFRAARLTGTLPDSQLSANVARLNGNGTFIGNVTFDPRSGPPFAVGNSDVVIKLNADQLDGLDASAFSLAAHNHDTNYWKLAGNTGASSTIIAGGTANRISDDNSFIGGGSGNLIEARFSSIGGGTRNRCHDIGRFSFIGGGHTNYIDSEYCFIGGGTNNQIETFSSFSAIAGGRDNLIDFQSTNYVIGGGRSNVVDVQSSFATIPGGAFNLVDGRAGFAAGYRAKVRHSGAFVWGDFSETNVSSSASNQFTVRASGGARFFSNTNLTAGVSLASGGGSWTTISDRNAKENFEPVDAQAVLDKVAALPLRTWNYRSQPNGIRHIGPMAQDFKAAFGLGESDTGITTVDADGVALAAIQGLNQKLTEELKRRDAENAELKQRLEQLERLFHGSVR